VIPTLGIFAFSVLRLLPSLQQVYASLASIRSGTAVLDHIHEDYTPILDQLAPQPAAAATLVAPLALTSALELKGLDYAYSAAGRPAVRGIDIRIPARTTIGIVGGTGAGKTTLIDLILGLLTPQAGEIVVDGVAITEANLRAWQRSLGYVPQSIYLTDDTIARNIAFGVPADRIDMQAVERAARIAALHDFVVQDLPKGYETLVGERGVRLSGGQRQRIGIARALYSDPSLLILDEATSALDNITERVVMEAVQNIRADKTIIIIAHRLTTVRQCDAIFLLEKGQVASVGTYDELVAQNETFRKMAAGM
jgi:ABC-type multidrug transport system fused ATPase/permease subunit